ncbi:MAG TPA: ABC transporter substrate-binding protein [Candidatus Acidoferrum sp.]|nr:ABC transporter substrate-binding protein [Candidatus Acidoferrum sp.]
MKLQSYLLLAAISVLLLGAGRAETSRRPRYGGTLRVEIGAVIHSLDPVESTPDPEESAAKDEIGSLLYDQRNPDGSFAGVAGSGAFHIAQWESGKRLTLAANESYRGGRAFVDAIEIEMGRDAKDRLVDLALGTADFAEIPPEEARHAGERGVRVSASKPQELVVLAFTTGRAAGDDVRAREALSRSIDRAAIVNFILQKEGEPAGGLLPQWSNGTAFLFPTAADTVGAKELWSQIAGSPPMALGYDSGDSLEQAIAERIAVNVRDAGITLSTEVISQASKYDLRLVRLRIKSSRPRDALAGFVESLGPASGLDIASLPANASAEQIYGRERDTVSTYRVVPLVWLPRVYGLGSRVRDWKSPDAGEGWPLADVWLEQESQ